MTENHGSSKSPFIHFLHQISINIDTRHTLQSKLVSHLQQAPSGSGTGMAGMAAARPITNLPYQ